MLSFDYQRRLAESSELILAGCAVLAVLCSAAAGVCESSLVVCEHEHGAMIVGAG